MVDAGRATVASRYQVYKEGTLKICTWLARAAGQDICALHIKVRDLLSFANTISAAANPAMYVSTAMIQLLDQVIAARQEFSAWYAARCFNDESKASNEGHQYFISVLQEILSTLQPFDSSQDRDPAALKAKSSSKKKPATSQEDGTFANVFALLDVEEPTGSPLGQRPAPKASSRKDQDKKLSLEQDSEVERSFKVFCFLEDAREIKLATRTAWEEFAAGEISFMAASLVLETGIGLLRICHAELVSTLPEFADWVSLHDLLNLACCTDEDDPRDILYLYPRPSIAGAPKQGAAEAIGHSYSAAAIQLHQLNHEVKVILDMAKGPRGYTEQLLLEAVDVSPHAWVYNKDLNDEYFAFSDFLRELIVELAMKIASKHYKKLPEERGIFHGSFVQGLEDFIETGHLPIWLAIAYECYCEIYQVIGSAPTLTGNLCVSHLKELQSRLRAYRPGTDGFRIGPLPNMTFVEELIATEKRVIETALGAGYGASDTSDRVIREQKPTLYRLPCQAGIFMHKSKVFYQQAGIDEASTFSTMLSLAYLYSAGRSLRFIKSTWVDMEFVLSGQKTVHPLMTRPRDASDPKSWLTCFLIALGVPAQKFAVGRVPDLPNRSEVLAKIRKLKVPSRLSRAIFAQHESIEAAGVERGDMLDNVLRSLAKKPAHSSPDNTIPSLTPLQLLANFKQQFIADEPGLNFDYFGFFETTTDIADEILRFSREALHLALGQYKPPHYQVVYELLESATHGPAGQNCTRLRMACEYFDRLLANKTNKFSQEALQQSSGHIPKHLRPQLKKCNLEDYKDSFIKVLMEHEKTLVVQVTPSHTTIYDPDGSPKRFQELVEKYMPDEEDDWEDEEDEMSEEDLVKLTAIMMQAMLGS